jgi:hypothetical protein
MTTTATTPATIGTCSKCDGTGRINAFSHIHAGACFACQGTGTVKIGAADAGTGKVQASKQTAIGSVRRFGSDFVVDLTTGGAAHFEVVAGRVNVFALSQGVKMTQAAITATLQAALRA